uniref:Uncharacterized protein n=1 Tax=Physcomitrium patens TaxID=3218 RepID=A0A2K1JN03_PHYPA|nr:hypothetical protein PHYPA_017751 [Physcomitrium patens]
MLLALLIGFNITGIVLEVESNFYDYCIDEKTIFVGIGINKIYKDKRIFEKMYQIYESIKDCPK